MADDLLKKSLNLNNALVHVCLFHAQTYAGSPIDVGTRDGRVAYAPPRTLALVAGYASSLRTHRLKGALAECFAARLSREYRIVFIFDAVRVVFLDIGTHDDVYR